MFPENLVQACFQQVCNTISLYELKGMFLFDLTKCMFLLVQDSA